MTHLVIRRGGKIYLPTSTRKRDIVDQLFDSIACLITFLLPLIKKMLAPPPSDFVEGRKEILKDYKLRSILWFKLRENWLWRSFLYHSYFDRRVHPSKIALLWTRERILATLTVLAIVLSLVFSVYPPTEGGAAEMNLPKMVIVPGQHIPSVPQPVNWVKQGEPTRYGSREAVDGAYDYAITADYHFASNEMDVQEMLAAGQLVELKGANIKLIDVSQPFAMPITAAFTNRLADQYAARGCGPLIVTSAIRTLEYQATLENGSENSVHPTGMSVDLRYAAKDEVGGVDCQEWLEDTLLNDIENSRRIDVTIEKNPAHFHVVVIPDAYEAFLKSRVNELDPIVHWLATAMYFEGHFRESKAGRTAIAWTIANRMRSEDYPNSIIGVIADGAAGRRNGGCQFSFMCDGAPENIQKPCNNEPNLAALCQQKWNEVVELAEELLPVIMDPSLDPTNGAVLYYAKWMQPKPPWARARTEVRDGGNGNTYEVVLSNGDFRPGTIRRIDNHIFGCSLFRGSDVCRHNEGVRS